MTDTTTNEVDGAHGDEECDCPEWCDYCLCYTPTGTSPSGVRYCDICAHDDSRNA